MKNEIVSLKVAKLAKEKGFNLKCAYWYGCDNPSPGVKANQLMFTPYNITNLGEISNQEGTCIYYAPTKCLLQKWLREVYNLAISISHEISFKWFWCIDIIAVVHEDYNISYPSGDNCNTYEEALDIALYESLKLIKNK